MCPPDIPWHEWALVFLLACAVFAGVMLWLVTSLSSGWD